MNPASIWVRAVIGAAATALVMLAWRAYLAPENALAILAGARLCG